MTATYCFSVSLDGDEQPVHSTVAPNDATAADYGRALLQAAIAVRKPKEAYCVVYASEGVDAEPLGAWDYAADTSAPAPVWTPADAEA